MYQCPNCGGNLKFDIPSQKLKCDHCESQFDPYSIKKDKDAEDSTEYDVTVFTCPQCGGQIVSTETSAAEFCSFCGASTILSSRISKEKKPDYIIPFAKTKEDCKKAYLKLMKHALFTPKEYKNPKNIDSFRGIYMPYWVYYYSQNGPVSMNGTHEYRRGDYLYKDYYDLHFNLDAYYKGLSYDASSSFSDNISESIAPYDVRDMKSFTPAILSGFYADIADVDSSLYLDNTSEIANDNTIKQIKNVPAFRDCTIATPALSSSMNNILHSECKEVNSSMFPVWFMSYRNKGRIAYATVIGQTGKAAADLPVSVTKYFLGSLLLAVPIFLLFNLIMTVKPTTTLIIAGIFAIITAIVYNVEVSAILKKENHEDDKGYLAKSSSKFGKQRTKRNNPATGLVLIVIIIAAIIAISTVSGAFESFFELNLFSNTPLIPIILLGITIIVYCTGSKKRKKLKDCGFKGIGNLGSLCSVIIGAIIAIIAPASDIYYYVGAILAFLGILLTNSQIITKYNILATRKLPQFDRKGGDDRA